MALDLIKSLKKSIRMINHHIGLGGDAHPAVNALNAGFMTPEQKSILEKAASDATNARGKRISMPAGTDVLTLPDGKYEISGAKNNPVGEGDYSFIEYDISSSSDGRRQFKAVISALGRQYIRTVHTGGSSTSGTNGWLCEPYLIWQGSITSGSIDLSGGLSENIKGLKVRLRSTTQQSDVIELMGTKNSSDKVITNISNDTSEASFQLYEIGLTFDGKNLTINKNNTMVAYVGSLGFTSLKGIMVTEVYGI